MHALKKNDSPFHVRAPAPLKPAQWSRASAAPDQASAASSNGTLDIAYDHAGFVFDLLVFLFIDTWNDA